MRGTVSWRRSTSPRRWPDISYNVISPDNVGSVLQDMEMRLRRLESGTTTSLLMNDSAGVKRVDIGLLSNGEYGIQINPTTTDSGMEIDSTVPAIKVFDGSGTQRVVIGNDSSIPGNFGMRVNDASGQ